jgi:Xaa-Pro aminopeptidase
MMKGEGLDCLVTPAVGGEGDADSIYLTQRPGWVVFPLEGPVAAITDGGDRGRGVGGHWADAVRAAERGLWSEHVIQALRELKMTRAKIGVGRLEGVLRNLEGDVSFTTLERVRTALPGASFVSAAEPMMRVKLLRSEEEIAVMEAAAAAGERGIETMIKTARPGVAHKDVWIEMFRAMTGATGERPSRLAIRAGDEANTSGGEPLNEVLQAGQIMNQEIGASVLGYMAQVNQSICIGGPPPADWKDAATYCIELLEEMIDWIQPGKRYIDLCQLYADRAKARSPELSPTWVLLHTCGLGDSPRMGLLRTETRDLVIEPTMTFTIKPRIIIKGARPTAQFGDPIVVTERGARRLGKRKLEPIAVG